MIKIIAILAVFSFFVSSSISQTLHSPKGKLTIESMNQTGVKDNTPGVESSNYNLLIGRLKFGAKIKGLEPRFDITTEVRLDQNSTSGALGFGLTVGDMEETGKTFSISLGAGKNFMRKDSPYRDTLSGKDQELFGYGFMHLGFKHFEAVVYASGNTNSLKEFYGKMLVRPTSYIGIGVMGHKSHPKLFKVFGYGEIALSTKAFMFKLFGGVGGYGEDGKARLTAVFGGKMDINFLTPDKKKKKR